MKVLIDLTNEQITDIKEQVPDRLDSTIGEAVHTFGERYQLIHAMEECGELIQAIGKYLRPDVENTRDIEDHIVEEVADVRIMCDQIEYIFEEYKFDAMKRKKMKKLQKQVEDFHNEQ